MVYKDILFEIYEGEGRKRLRVLSGQGIPVKHIRSSHADRDSFSIGTVFRADLSDHQSEKYYTFSFAGTSLKVCKFADSVSDPKVLAILASSSEAPVLAKKIVASFDIPEIPGDLQISAEVWKFLNASLKLKKYPFLIGPKGCGKSEVARRLAEANKMDFFEFDMGQALKPKKFFIGGLVNGNEGKTEIVRSEFFTAYTSDKPTLIFLDELTRIPSAAANFLMTVLSRNQSFIYSDDEGKRYIKGENVYLVAAGNIGYSYVSANRLDSAFDDRFVKVTINYMDAASEIKLMMSRIPEVNYSQASTIVKAANLLRDAEKKGSLTVSLSTRQVLDAAAYISLGYTVTEVIKQVILTNYIVSEEFDVAQQIIQAM